VHFINFGLSIIRMYLLVKYIKLEMTMTMTMTMHGMISIKFINDRQAKEVN
jgi:hypothetical protein